jgi:hydroxymethylglutaryl-CoA lyase
MIKILETPRDAMQGISHFIPTAQKVDYLSALLKVGFDTLDFGSFVSPKAIPQMRDSAEVIEQLETKDTKSRIIATIGNYKGAVRAFEHDKIDGVAYPFSISETFLQKNINSNFAKSEAMIQEIWHLCQKKNKGLKIYIAMAFGNPYGDPWSLGVLSQWVEKVNRLGIDDIVLADTTGDGSAAHIGESFRQLSVDIPNLKPGVHLHTTPQSWYSKLDAAYENGCRSFDSVLGGFGGCPMSGKALMGNLDTSSLIGYLDDKGVDTHIDREAYFKARSVAAFTFGR